MVLVCSEAENVVKVRAGLGQDVNFTCSINHTDIYWYMEIKNQLRIKIGQVFSSTVPSYVSANFKTKYLMVKNQLVIKNVSAEDSRLYFCWRTENGSGDTFLLISDVSSSVNRSIPPPVSVIKAWQKELVVLTSFSLNAVLFVAVLGFICVSVKKKGCCCCSVKDSAEYILDQQEMQNPRYEEIQLPPTQFPSE
ncbi:hypothetical protein CHARACLAT_001054 [Characodon lateralis]|uniref:Ig-like domain-containing protein n=1 Tax=Characodon lateralis TaxID=208331 RepID=A0ABU7E7W9_9TELE|nr:hypothetical protein [Characodon lateralis]